MEHDPDAVIGRDERVKAVVAIESLLRILRHAVDCFPDDDLETFVVYLTVAAASTGSHLRDRGMLQSLDGGPLPTRLHKPISGRAVAESTPATKQ